MGSTRQSSRRTEDWAANWRPGASAMGTPSTTARSTAFRRMVKEAIESGSADHWHPRHLNGTPAATDHWIVGTPAINAPVNPLVKGIDVHLATEVTAIDRQEDTWHFRTLQNDTGEPFDIVVISAPARQARAILASEPAIAEAPAKVSIRDPKD